MTNARTKILNAVATIAAIAASGGCSDFASCDPGERLTQGLCLPQSSPPTGDAGALDAAVASACGPDAATGGEFGRTCTRQSDCACPAPICAVQPGATSGYCTQIDCDEDSTICPAGFQCIDLSALDPSYPFTCLKNG